MNALQEQFVTEARDLIHQATDDLIAAEREGFSSEKVDRIFRAFHTLKGSAGVVDLPPMGVAMHAAEDLLAEVANKRVRSSPIMINQMLACLDKVSTWVSTFEAQQALPPRAWEEARTIADALRLLAASGSAGANRLSDAIEEKGLPAWVDRLIKSQHSEGPAKGHEEGSIFALSYEPVPGCFFDGDDPLELVRRIPNLLALHIEPREAWLPLGDLDPFSCNLRLEAISSATKAELAALFRLVPDQVRILEIPAARRAHGEHSADRDIVSVVRSVLEEQGHLLRAAEGRNDRPGYVGSAARVGANALRHAGHDDWADRLEISGLDAISHTDSAHLLRVIDEALSELFSDPVVEISKTNGEAPASASRILRVDESKIDGLLDLAGELLILKNGFAHLAKRVEDEGSRDELSRMIRSQQEAVDRLATELHSSILQLRMVPVAQVFRSLPRLIRDLAGQLNKNVALVTRGETTESDKAIVDLLLEPLVHLVRNAIDHGIETREEREVAGKSAAATITLAASRAGDRFIVDVSDDGRGIDPVVVRRKAEEKGMLTASELAALSDEQAIELIFSAGFSTAPEVSDISGRGVGMDVVRSSIERVGGRASLRSRLGQGTTVSLELPVNIGMSRIMVVEAGGQVFGIPMDVVTETLRLLPDQISRIKNNDGFILRDRVVPICSLSELLHLSSDKRTDTETRLVVVTDIGGRVTAIEVDAVREPMEVVLKPMHGLLSNARSYSGTTLTGDGSVLLILDMREIVP